MYYFVKKLFNILKKKYNFFINYLIVSILKDQKKFSYIYKVSYWKNKIDGSKSGSGSILSSTNLLISELNKFNEVNKIKSILDIPCGDWHWMNKVYLKNISYVGCDIVSDLIKDNSIKYSSNNICFLKKDLSYDALIDADLVLIRDLFVHLSNKKIFLCIKNIKKIKFKYLAITNYVNIKKNGIGTIDDNWRPINLRLYPFNFPQPDYVLNDSSNDGEYENYKRLFIWNYKKIIEHNV
jgi:hypothetical protein